MKAPQILNQAEWGGGEMKILKTNGEWRLCKPDIFDMTYELVDK